MKLPNVRVCGRLRPVANGLWYPHGCRVIDMERYNPDRVAALAHEYAQSHYFAAIGKREWLFQVGQHAGDIERQLIADSYLFITAWNPALHVVDAAENHAAGERLQARVSAAGHPAYPALGCDADGGNIECGLLVLNATLATADAMACEFDQLGVLYWRHGEPVRLRMLAAQPPGFPAHSHIDWLG
ncbi:MAG: DUF3293 domain-containing protein [Pseudoxanthomonas sp.]